MNCLSGLPKHKKLLHVLKKLFPNTYSYVLYSPKRVFHERPKLSLQMRRTIVHILRLEIESISKVMARDLSHCFDAGITE